MSEKPMDILKHLVPSKLLTDDLELIEDKLNKAIEALEFYACGGYYITRAVYGSEDGKSMMGADNGKIARETLDEIRKRSIDLRGEETKESQDKQVEKVE